MFSWLIFIFLFFPQMFLNNRVTLMLIIWGSVAAVLAVLVKVLAVQQVPLEVLGHKRKSQEEAAAAA